MRVVASTVLVPSARSCFIRLSKLDGRVTNRTVPGGDNIEAIPATCAANSRVGVNIIAILLLLILFEACSRHKRSVNGNRYANVLPDPVAA